MILQKKNEISHWSGHSTDLFKPSFVPWFTKIKLPRLKMLNVHESLFKKCSWCEAMMKEGQPFVPKGLNLVQQDLHFAKIQRQNIEDWASDVLLKKLNEHNLDFKKTSFFSFLPKSTPSIDKMKSFISQSMNKVICHPIMFAVGVYYLFKFLETYEDKLTEKEFLLYYSVCISLASKTHEDRFFGNSYYHHWFNWEKSNVTLLRFSSVELEILLALDFKLFVSYKDIKSFISKHKLASNCK